MTVEIIRHTSEVKFVSKYEMEDGKAYLEEKTGEVYIGNKVRLKEGSRIYGFSLSGKYVITDMTKGEVPLRPVIVKAEILPA